MKIAIQGNAGSFHSIAAKTLYGDEALLVYCETFKKAFEALAGNRADRAIVALENSLYGSLNDTYDLLLKHNFHIVGEVYEQVRFYLWGIEGSSLTTITDVYSQAPALGECEQFLEEKLPQAAVHEYYDTAAAAEFIKQINSKTKAAISSKPAGELNGLSCLASGIETHSDNYTRFIALSKTPNDTATATKTSLTFRTADTPGSLYAALGAFAKQNINLTKLESRPIIGEAWQYMYYVDFAAGIESDETQHALKELRQYAREIRVLGSYSAGSHIVA
jgi:prephenate dehydratase